MTSVHFQHRRTRQWLDFAPGVTFRPLKWSWSAIGGPRAATIEATGSPDDIAGLLQWIGYGVRIDGDNGAPGWWGKVTEVRAVVDGIPWTASVHDMYNRVAVAYTTLAPGQARDGLRATTAWAENAASIAEYGRREMLDSIGNTSAEHATARRDNRLARRAFPRLKPDFRAGDEREVRAEIECAGLWPTLEWVYALVPTAQVLAFQTVGTLTGTLGRDYDNDAYNVRSVAQSFDTGASAWNLQQAAIYVGRTGIPASGLTVTIAENPDDLTPGATLASATLDAGDIPETPGWVVATFAVPYLTTPGETYFLMVDFSGTADPDNYYTFWFDQAQGYGAGSLRIRVASTWAAGPAADMPFRLYVNEVIENADQIRNLLIDCGQFLARVHLNFETGIATESYRNGDSLAIDEIEALLETGTTAGKRLLATVNLDNSVTVYPEPDDDNNHFIGRDGLIYQGQAEMDPQSCPCGFWARTTRIRPINIMTGNLSEADAVFVEGYEFDADAGRGYPEIDTEHDVWDQGEQYG